MAEQPRQLSWKRFSGEFASAGRSSPARGVPTIGVAPDRCPDCGSENVVIAAVHPSGVEISIGLDTAVALDVANAILDAYAVLAPRELGPRHG